MSEKMNSRKKLFIGLGVIGVGVIAGIMALQSDGDKSAAVNNDAASVAGADSAVMAGPAYKWLMGSSVTYRFANESVMAPNHPKENRAVYESPMTKNISSGYFNIKPISKTDSTVTALVRFSDVTFQYGHDIVSDFKRLLEETPFLITWSITGKKISTRFPDCVAQEDREFIQGSIPRQIVLSSEGAKIWQMQERDGNGVYTAAYRCGDALTDITKSKKSYEHNDGKTESNTSIDIVSSNISAVIGDFWLESLKADEILKFSLFGGQMVLWGKHSSSFEQVNSQPVWGDLPWSSERDLVSVTNALRDYEVAYAADAPPGGLYQKSSV